MDELNVIDLAGRYKFVLNAFALDKVRTTVYRPGKPLESKVSEGEYKGGSLTQPDNQGNYEVVYDDKGTTNMHTGTEGRQPISPLGTPVFCDMILTASTTFETSFLPETTTETIQLLWVLVEVTQTKNIVKTQMLGKDGTVKEYISMGDYIVKIRGALVNTFRKDYPKNKVEKLVRIFKKNQALDVVSEYLMMFGIYNLVVDDFTMGQQEGKQNIQKFEATCSSDEPLKLRKKRGV